MRKPTAGQWNGARTLIRRVAPALVLGFVLASSLWFGFVPFVMRGYAAYEPPAGSSDPRTLSFLSFLVNAVLLAVLVAAGRIAARRSARERTK